MLTDGDVEGWASVTLVQWVGISISNECALAWPVRAFARGSGMWVGGGKKQRSDGAMFGNGWLPNIAIISNQVLNY